MRLAVLLFIASSAAAQGFDPPLVDPEVRLRAETVLDATRWQGARQASEARTDVRQRLGMDGFLLRSGPRATVHLDLEVGSDFGPESDGWRAQPDARRMVLDVYAAHLDLHTEAFDARLGRQVLYDVLGVDALDGLSVRLRALPHLTIEGAGGLATRRGWSSFGPDVFEPDGTRLSDEAGYIVRTRIATRRVSWLAASAGWMRTFDTYVQREQAAVDARVGLEIFNVNGQLRHALAVDVLEDAALGIGSNPGSLRLHAGWRRHRPVFSADSIWNAFRPEPWDAWEARAGLRLGAFDLATDAALRTYRAGSAHAQAPALTAFDDPPTLPDATATEAGASISRVVGEGRVGVEARYAGGHGGARHYADVFARLPWLATLGREPVWLQARAGAIGFGEVDEESATALTGWGLLAAEWRPEESIRLEALGEVYAGGPDPTRMRVMLRMRLEDGW